MDFDAFARAFGVDPRAALAGVRKPAPGVPRRIVREHGIPAHDPMAESHRPRLRAGGFTRAAEGTGFQSIIYASHDAPTHVHKGRRMRGVLERVRQHLAARSALPEGLAAIFPEGGGKPNSVPCDGEYIVRMAAPGGGHPAFPLLPGAYGAMTQYLMRAISALHTMWGAGDTHINVTVLIERIDKTLARLRRDTREA